MTFNFISTLTVHSHSGGMINGSTFSTPISWAREKITTPNGYMKKLGKETLEKHCGIPNVYVEANAESKVFNIAPVVK
eukprot:326027-Hanusia_phi.AAC.1